MENYLKAIKLACQAFPIVFTQCLLFIPLFKNKFKLKDSPFIVAFIFYLTCVLALTQFPLPTIEEALALKGHQIQLVPFHFIIDIIKESPLIVDDLSTYCPALFNFAIIQVELNIIMTIPFGFFMSMLFKKNKKEIIMYSFLFTFFIEALQFTGLAFIYKGSYRLADIDDIMANTLGGFLGFYLYDFIIQLLTLPKVEITLFEFYFTCYTIINCRSLKAHKFRDYLEHKENKKDVIFKNRMHPKLNSLTI